MHHASLLAAETQIKYACHTLYAAILNLLCSVPIIELELGLRRCSRVHGLQVIIRELRLTPGLSYTNSYGWFSYFAFLYKVNAE
jgi:hypothetical protein